MKIYIGTDHAGYEMKNELVEYLTALGYEVGDKGAHVFDESDDYPDFVEPVVENVSKEPETRGIVLGKSGQGEAMMANRTHGIRAAVYYGGSDEIVRLSREHNDANILSLGAGFLDIEEAKRIVKLWLETPFSGDERHRRRLEKIDM